MNISDHQIKAHFHADEDVFFREDHLLDTIQKSKAAFYESEADGMLSRAEFIYYQSKYIHKRWWLLQACVLLMLWILLDMTKSEFFIRRCMGIAAPLFAVLLLPELWKNKSAGAMEIEGSTRYCLRQVYAARIFLFALADLPLITVFTSAAVASGQLLPESLVANFFLPLFITCCIAFRTLYSRKITSESLALLLCIVFCTVWTQIVLIEGIYDSIEPPVWFAASLAAACYLGVCIYRGQKNCTQFLEVHPLWN